MIFFLFIFSFSDGEEVTDDFKCLDLDLGKRITLFHDFENSLLPSDKEAELKLDEGIFKGKLVPTGLTSSYESYKSIPYAKPPIGDLRWSPPKKIEKFENEKHDGTQWAKKLCHSDLEGIEISGEDYESLEAFDEDCLSMDIYKPSQMSKNESGYPIMVFIHGGGFSNGFSSCYLGWNFMEMEVIYIAIQYRLGMFGFMSTYQIDNGIGGNYGLMDQQIAFEFIKRNAINMNGDPNRITILGESAGGQSVAYHMLNPTSTNLFNVGISQSGAAMFDFSSQQSNHANEAVVNLCKEMNKTKCSNPNQAIQSLREVNASKLQSKNVEMGYNNTLFPNYPIWAPVRMDGIFFKQDAQQIVCFLLLTML